MLLKDDQISPAEIHKEQDVTAFWELMSFNGFIIVIKFTDKTQTVDLIHYIRRK